MKFGNYNPEKKEKGSSQIYIKVIFFAMLLAFGLIGGGIALKFIIKLIIKYWVWCLGIIGSLLFVKNVLLKRKKKDTTPSCQDYYE